MNYETIVLRKIQKVGNSLGVVLPSEILRALKFERGDQLIFRVYEGDNLVIRKITNEEKKVLKPDVII